LLLAPSPGRSAPALGQRVDGMSCDQQEGAVFHIHQHVAIFDHGKPVAIPARIGIPPHVPQCIYWLHTHTDDGVIHVEAPQFRSFTLGEFFDIWGQPLSATAVGPARVKKGQLHAFVDGMRYAGDPRKIELAQHTDITLEAGPPYSKPVLFTNWAGQ
jgi:hypothetical protein